MFYNILRVCALLPFFATSIFASMNEERLKFFADESTDIRVIRYYDEATPEGNCIKARIKAINGEERRRVALPVVGPLQESGWHYEDEALRAVQHFIGNVEVNRDDFLRVPAPYTRGFVAYTPLVATEEHDGELTVGNTVTVFAHENWQRPDNTVYSRRGNPLFRLRLIEEREALPQPFKTCVSSEPYMRWHGFKSGLKTRYYIQNWTQEEVTHITEKLAVEADDLVESTSVRAYIALRKADKYPCNSNEAGRGADLPDGYRVVG